MNTSNEENNATKNRFVALYVKTKELFELGERATEDEIDNLTSLVSNEHNDITSSYLTSNWQSHKEFELDVFKDHTMQWTLPQQLQNTADRGYEVNLISVHHEPEGGNPNIFGTEDLIVGPDGTITATILHNAEMSQDYIYTIKFTITFNGVTKKYSLDPKLAVNP